MSKAFNMTGWRLAWIYGNALVVRAFADVKDNFDSGQFKAIQKAAMYALLSPCPRPASSLLCVACGADGARPAWRSTEFSPAAGVRVRLGRALSGDTGEVRGGAGGWARVKSGFIFERSV